MQSFTNTQNFWKNYNVYMLILIFLLVQATILYLFGQPIICTCGYIKIWEGIVKSSGNSQHLVDWYTFSHIIHGFIFYYLAGWLFPKLSFQKKLLLAIGIEVGWEILENTPMVINHYRKQALAQGYAGDSILNSLSDTLAMIGGFFLVKKLPGKVILILAIAMEIFTLFMIRDSLAFNIVNLVHPFSFIQKWQMSR